MPFQRLFDCFFSEENIQNTLILFYHYNQLDDEDVFSKIIIEVLKNEFNPCFTEFGISPFLSNVFIFIPYEALSKQQLQICRDFCTEMHLSSTFNAVQEIGGGLHVTRINMRSNSRYVDSAMVLFACKILLESVQNDEMAYDLSNVVFQRITSVLSIAPSRIQQAEHMWLNYKNSRQT